MIGKPALDVDLTRLAPATLVADLITPLETLFLAEARKRGCVDKRARPAAQSGGLAFKASFGVLPDVTLELRRPFAPSEHRSCSAMTILTGRRSTATSTCSILFAFLMPTMPIARAGESPAAHLVRVLDAFDVSHA
jgi:hypothetical protein